jgi:diguanylate cyclase (GGDEF)-like protein/putative nucleotidyltransferase with HDIG domain
VLPLLAQLLKAVIREPTKVANADNIRHEPSPLIYNAGATRAQVKKMQFPGLDQYSKPARLLWLVLLVTATVIAAGAAAAVVQYPVYKISVLLSAIFICALMSRYELRLPKTQIEISVGTILAIWGVFWLGISGGILLAAAASVSRLFRDRTVDPPALLNVCLRVISIAVGATTVSLFLVVEQDTSQWASARDPWTIMLVTVVMPAVAYALFNALDVIFQLAAGTLLTDFGRTLRLRAVQIPPVVLGAFVLCGLFAKFGISFGIVVVPITVFAIAAYRIHLSRLEQKTKQILEASRVHLATVEALATAIDARDQVGHGHIRRTQIYAVGLGEALGLGDDDINALRTGALLHDIGKLAVPDHILSKSGPLTPAELEKTKIHAPVGAAILERVGFQYPVVPTVKYHHERWDGKGYPDGLSGEEIPLTARILAIADTYDTLRSARSFRAGMPRVAAREMLRKRAGTHFDPSLMGVFLKKLNALEAAIEIQGLSYGGPGSPERAAEDQPQSFVEQIKLANKEVFTLFELAREFGSSENLTDMLSLFTSKLKELVPFDTVVIYLLDATRRYANAAHVSGRNQDILHLRRIKVGEGATGIVLKRQEMVKNVNPDLDFSLSHLELIQQYSTMISLPLIAENDVIGAVSLYSHDLDEYGDEHIRLLETVAHIGAEAIAKSQQHAETKAHALTDPMTGLPNARSLQKHFEKEMARAARTGSNIQVLVMDLDGFKAVNDTFGHKVGDQMLREVGRVIGEQLRDYDFLSRYGGDEFVAVIPGADQMVVLELCSRIEKAVCELKLEIEPDGPYASVGVSLGTANYPQQGETFDQMIVAADKAMYVRKSARKGKAPVEVNEISVAVAEICGDLSFGRSFDDDLIDLPAGDGFIVELDETHVIATSSVN